MKKFLIFLLIVAPLFAKVTESQIANMFILGFYGNANSICSDLKRGLGGVIIFKKSPIKRGAYKNFSSPQSLKELTKNLKNCNNKVLIAIDQEGGLVQRLKFNNIYPKAALVAKRGENYAKKIYTQMAKELKSYGINYNLAPVADLAINPKNRVIKGFGRSYGSDYKEVIKYDKIFIKAMQKYNIATALKHFPGHGSSIADTHKGFVDVTNFWQEIELKPFIALKNYTNSIMVAHIFNKKLDSKYPASLSKNVINNLLRKKIKFNKVVISDDLQMGAIAKNYSLKEVIKRSINSGVDIMLFANQVHKNGVVKLNELINIVKELLNSKQIDESLIKAANLRINALKAEVCR